LTKKLPRKTTEGALSPPEEPKIERRTGKISVEEPKIECRTGKISVPTVARK
jgi:hypothetical protein